MNEWIIVDTKFFVVIQCKFIVVPSAMIYCEEENEEKKEINSFSRDEKMLICPLNLNF
jgi:hypothetical protein